jgi:hypothetical protein
MTKWIAGLGLSAALAFAAPATADAQPVVTGGLVNVTVTDALNNVLSSNDVGIAAALSVAANICGVAVNVLAADLQQDGKATCTNATGQTVTLTQRRRR